MRALFTIFAAIVTLMSLPGFAGAFNGVPVAIDFDQAFAEGTTWTARSSNNDIEVSGCGHKGVTEPVDDEYFPWHGVDTPVNTWAWRRTRDAYGEEVVCFAHHPALMYRVSNISPVSGVRFEFTETRNDCQISRYCAWIDVTTQYSHPPYFLARPNHWAARATI